MTDQDLPSYTHPPVVEVSAGASFERLPAQAIAQFGAFWASRLSDTFPTVQVQPPYFPPVERFGTASYAPELTLQLRQELPAPRFWFLAHGEDELLQLQPDWLACNWRKVQPDAEYGRWPSRRAAFLNYFNLLNSYLKEAGLGPIIARQCEVTYVNHVLPNKVWQEHKDLGKILRIVTSTETSLVQMEQADVRFHFAMPDEEGKQVGRLHITAVPGFVDMNKTPIYRLELTARGDPLGEGIDGVMRFLDKGRETIVATFAEVTTEEIQHEWGVQ